MEKTRKIFISDIHLSSEALYSDPKNVSWYKPSEHDERLLGFLDNYVLANKDIIQAFLHRIDQKGKVEHTEKEEL